MRNRLESLPVPVWLAVLALTWLACSGLSAALCGAGFLHPESQHFLSHYLAHRPVLDLIYDNLNTDWGTYQAREMSFLFAWVDARFIEWSALHGHVHFFSLVHYLFLLVAGVVLWWIAVHHGGLSRLTAAGLAVILWTCPTAMFYTSFYRTSKVGLLLAIMLAAWAWCAARVGQDGPRSRIRAGLFGALLVLMPMFDKQGFLFLCGAVAFLGWQAWQEGTPRARHLLVAGVAALIFAWCYQRFLGPAITRHLVGYEGDRRYATVPWHALLTQPKLIATFALGAPLMAFDSFRYLLGNLPAGIALVALGWLWKRFAFNAPGRGWVFAGLCLLITGVYAAMLMVFPDLFSNEHRRFFYCLPAAALWLLAIVAALAFWKQRNWTEIAVALLVLGNLYALQEHRFLLRHGKYAPYVENAIRVRAALQPTALAASGLHRADAAERLKQAPYLGDAVAADVMQDRIYLTLAARLAPE